MWTEGIVKIVGDRSESGGKYVVANVDIPPGKFSDLKGLFIHWFKLVWIIQKFEK